MKVVILTSEAYQVLLEKLDSIEQHLIKQTQKELVDTISWVDNDEVCKYLNISKRTLQRYRSKGLIAYSLMGKKVYYSFLEIQDLRKKYFQKPPSPESDLQ